MPSRSVRRRQHKRIVQLRELSEGQRRVIATWHLKRWRIEANRRANDLGEPAVWALEAGERPKALALDPTGELAEELSRVCAEAVSRASGDDLIGGSKRRADQARLALRG